LYRSRTFVNHARAPDLTGRVERSQCALKYFVKTLNVKLIPLQLRPEIQSWVEMESLGIGIRFRCWYQFTAINICANLWILNAHDN
jgi:hypothetical protein